MQIELFSRRHRKLQRAYRRSLKQLAKAAETDSDLMLDCLATYLSYLRDRLVLKPDASEEETAFAEVLAQALAEFDAFDTCWAKYFKEDFSPADAFKDKSKESLTQAYIYERSTHLANFWKSAIVAMSAGYFDLDDIDMQDDPQREAEE